MDSPSALCTVCNSEFQVRFRYQVSEQANGSFAYFCSQNCQQNAAGHQQQHSCEVCGREFVMEHDYQVTSDRGSQHYFCSTPCRTLGSSQMAPNDAATSIKRIAVFNHKGGTAKTTTAINLAAGLAERGKRVLLVDADGQGNVGAALGIHGEQNLYHCLVHGVPASEIAVPVRKNLDVVTSNEMLAAAELYLANQPNRHRIMRERLANGTEDYDTIILDCAPALSLMNQNALMFADSVVVPVSCDYLALYGVKQVLRTIKSIRQAYHHDLDLLGVLPTFFDVRNRICRDSVDALNRHFKERSLPPVRVNTRLREAPSVKQTIFEYAPDSTGATDYLVLVQHIFDLQSHNSDPLCHQSQAVSVAAMATPQVTVTGFQVPTV